MMGFAFALPILRDKEMEFIKELAQIIAITAIAFIGYLLIEATFAFDFFDSNGAFLWRTLLLVLALLFVGGMLVYLGEKLWGRLSK